MSRKTSKFANVICAIYAVRLKLALPRRKHDRKSTGGDRGLVRSNLSSFQAGARLAVAAASAVVT